MYKFTKIIRKIGLVTTLIWAVVANLGPTIPDEWSLWSGPDPCGACLCFSDDRGYCSCFCYGYSEPSKITIDQKKPSILARIYDTIENFWYDMIRSWWFKPVLFYTLLVLGTFLFEIIMKVRNQQPPSQSIGID